ncbi:class I SAM-dependent methyltransferase [Sphingomonas sp.]|jgi:predicted TPR repeat methyltransferase|uniref:class I SAM-dependent DNA methyltransferase n=1 Tax=Sphingomonas sp. TaxID=28214 RepID=UPI002EDB017E
MPDRIAEHYERHAHAFDLARRKQFVEKGWLDRLLLAVPKGGHILDLGCGAGEPIGRYLIDTGHALTGVDISGAMIGLARTRFGRHRWLKADMRAVAVEGQFPGVLAWDSLFHLPHDDQAAMMGRAANWLEPGGAFLFNTGPARGEAIGSQFGEDIYHASLAPFEYRALFEELRLLEIASRPMIN